MIAGHTAEQVKVNLKKILWQSD